MKSKWFKFNGKCFESKKRASTIREAWDKTLEKWGLKMDGWRHIDAGSTCGLCNLYPTLDCYNCPIKRTTGQSYCKGTPINESPDLEYLFLLFVKEATKKC